MKQLLFKFLPILIKLALEKIKENRLKHAVNAVSPAKEARAKLALTKKDQIKAAIKKLNPKNKEHWAYFGKKAQRPDLDQVQKILGWRPTVNQVKEAWKDLQS